MFLGKAYSHPVLAEIPYLTNKLSRALLGSVGTLWLSVLEYRYQPPPAIYLLAALQLLIDSLHGMDAANSAPALPVAVAVAAALAAAPVHVNAALAAAADAADAEDLETAQDAQARVCLAAQAFLVLSRTVLTAGKRFREEQETDAEPGDKVRRMRDLRERVGRGNAVIGHRAAYQRGASRFVYDNISHAHHPTLCMEETHLGPVMFEHMFEIVAEELLKPFDIGMSSLEAGAIEKKPRKRLLGCKEMFFMYLVALGGANEGGIGVRKLGRAFGVGKSTASRYFAHCAIGVYAALKEDPDRLRWETVEERAAQRNIVPGFGSCVGFVDGAKIGRWRPEDEVEQERVYDGRKHCHCFGVTIFNNVFGEYTKIVITDLGSDHDRRVYTQTPPYVSPEEHFSEGEHLIADLGYIGDGAECVCPFKKGQGLDFALRGAFNRSIRGVRMVNEWSVGFITNRHRIFLGRWPFDPALFTPAFESCALMANEVFHVRGYALQTRERYAEKRARYEASL